MKKFFKNKKVFITGHTGFKGIWLTSILNHFGAKIYGYSKQDSTTRNYKKLSKDLKVNDFFGDILDKKKLDNELKKIKPDIVIHFAAQSLVQESYNNPVTTINTNIIGTCNLLESCRSINSIKVILIATSDKCYENKDDKIKYFYEDNKLGGDDPYSASKACTEIIFNSYLKSFYLNKKIGLASVRAGNVIGGGDWSDNRIIPDCARSIIYKKKLILRNPNSIRPWQHILDVLNGYLILVKKLYLEKNKQKFNGSYNFGPIDKKKYDVNHIVNEFFKILNVNKEKKVIKKRNIKKEKKILLLNSNKSKKILKWQQKIKINKAIKLTAEWYNFYINQNKNITLDQIKNCKLFS
jgi:CDP-glucose 4,6-dehydratase